jgi:signal transduction histidine kinase
MILYSIIKIVFKGAGKILTWIITGIITALALIALPSNFLEAIRIQYGAMGAAILSVIPFIIMLVFSLKVGSRMTARIVWIFFVIYYFALYLDKILRAKTSFFAVENIPYLFCILAGIIIFFFIGGIRNLLFKEKMKAVAEGGQRIVARGGLLHKLQKKELEESYGDSE